MSKGDGVTLSLASMAVEGEIIVLSRIGRFEPGEVVYANHSYPWTEDEYRTGSIAPGIIFWLGTTFRTKALVSN